MRRTPMYQFHTDYKAHFGEYAGYEMPLYYSSPMTEHKQVRTSGGIFDVSHMARVKISGRHARRFLETVCTRRISDMQNGQCRYSLVCNEKGGVKDDIIVYRMDDDDYLLVINCANRAKIVEHFQQVIKAREYVLKLDDTTDSTVMVALQGPKIISQIPSNEVKELKRYRFCVKNLLVAKVIISRTGYTGEDGVEAIFPSGMLSMVKGLLFDSIDMNSETAVIKPAGLVARDTLRTEASMPLYGQELGEDICALSSGVDFAISMDKHTQERGERFIGQDALEKVKADGGPSTVLIGMNIEGKRTARQGMTILHEGKTVGVVSSGCPSPTLDRCIAMGFVPRTLNAVGTPLQIDSGRGMVNAVVTAMPFYKAPKTT